MYHVSSSRSTLGSCRHRRTSRASSRCSRTRTGPSRSASAACGGATISSSAPPRSGGRALRCAVGSCPEACFFSPFSGVWAPRCDCCFLSLGLDSRARGGCGDTDDVTAIRSGASRRSRRATPRPRSRRTRRPRSRRPNCSARSRACAARAAPAALGSEAAAGLATARSTYGHLAVTRSCCAARSVSDTSSLGLATARSTASRPRRPARRCSSGGG